MELDEAQIGDLVSGAVYGMTSCFIIGWVGFILAILTSILFWMGGRGILGWNGWRRFVMPSVLCFTVSMYKPHTVGMTELEFLSLFAQMGVLCIGYSTPDVNEPKSSPLGMMFGKYARCVWYTLLAISMIPLFI